VVQSMAHAVAVMYLGEIVEQGAATEIFSSPRHPYTAALLASSPSPDPESRADKRVLEGDVPSAVDPPPGCRFHPRCGFRMPVCEHEHPVPHRVGQRLVACHLPDDTEVNL
jgi:oligopeptide/dipeptide ABC transporter ATP-binding protein